MIAAVRRAVLVLAAAQGCARAPDASRSPATPARPPDAAAQATLCAVMRAYAPRSLHWAGHGCPPDPAPVPAVARPCRVVWHGRPEGGTALDYDDAGRLIGATNHLVSWRYTYDDAGQLTGLAWTYAEAPAMDGAIEVRRGPDEIAYDHDARFVLRGGVVARIEIAPPGAPWHLRYQHGRLTSVAITDPRDPGATASLRLDWDDHGRLRRREADWTGGRRPPDVATFTWDAAGRLTAIVDPDGETAIEYDCPATDAPQRAAGSSGP